MSCIFGVWSIFLGHVVQNLELDLQHSAHDLGDLASF